MSSPFRHVVAVKQGWIRLAADDTPIFNINFPLVRRCPDPSPSVQAYLVDCSGHDHSTFPFRMCKVFARPGDARVSRVALTAATSPPKTARIPSMMHLHERIRRLVGMCWRGDIVGFMLSGEPGGGKSFPVEDELERLDLPTYMQWADDVGKADGKPDPKTTVITRDGKPQYQSVRFIIVPGSVSEKGLYELLWKFSAAGSILVFDDNDDVVSSETKFNLLKAACDSRRHRWIAWVSSMGHGGGVPDRFEFHGSVILITNKAAVATGAAAKIHLPALMQRLPKVHLPTFSRDEKLEWVRFMAREALKHLSLEESEIAECVALMAEHVKAENMTLRTLGLIGKFRKTRQPDWATLARETLV